jgi:hypothetical protein
MTGIVEFLTARLNEDEQTARAATGKYRSPTWRVDGDDETLLIYPDDGSTGFTFDGPIAPHIARHDPARVLADVAAKRKIVEMHRPQYVSDDPDKHYGSHYEVIGSREILVRDEEPHLPNWCRTCQELSPCPTVRQLALPHADHPDYDPAWRP